MRTCVVVPVRVANRPGFLWRWRSLDTRARSPYCFQFFFDCLQAAERAGYAVDLEKSRELADDPEVVSAAEYRVGPAEGS